MDPNSGNSFFDYNYGAHPYKYLCTTLYNQILRAPDQDIYGMTWKSNIEKQIGQKVQVLNFADAEKVPWNEYLNLWSS